MSNGTERKKIARMSDEAVKAKTGKTWSEWFAILDAAGAKKMDHKGIVAHLTEQYKVGPWWRQMVTVGYEQARGMRELHQGPEGYGISVSRTITVPIRRLFKAWEDNTLRHRWLPDTKFEIRKSSPEKSMRITWEDGRTTVEANFYARGDSKSQVTAQHSKLRDAKEADRMKAYWVKSLDRLKELLEA